MLAVLPVGCALACASAGGKGSDAPLPARGPAIHHHASTWPHIASALSLCMRCKSESMDKCWAPYVPLGVHACCQRECTQQRMCTHQLSGVESIAVKAMYKRMYSAYLPSIPPLPQTHAIVNVHLMCPRGS